MKRPLFSTVTTIAITAGIIAAPTAAPTAAAAPISEICEIRSADDRLYTCAVRSEAMDRDIPVVVRPSPENGAPENENKVIQFFSGIDGREGWINQRDANDVRVMDHLREEDATLVFLTSEARSFYVDWDSPAPPDDVVMKYETFVTEELPAFLEHELEIPDGGHGRTGLVGLSMTAYSVLNLASKHPDRYASVLAMSGFYNNQSLVGRAATDLSAETHGENNSGVPWDNEFSRAQDNPILNVQNLNMPVYVSTSTGIPHDTDREDYSEQTLLEGAGLEAGTLIATLSLDAWARLLNKPNVQVTYVPTGIHAWNTWLRAAFTDRAAGR